MSEPEREEDVVAGLARVAEGLGASAGQAQVMARQLWKRSLQIAEKRGIKQVDALEELLRLMISGSQGVGPEKSNDDGD